MKKAILTGLIVITAAVIVFSFFKPWAHVSASVTQVSKELAGAADDKLKDTPFAGKFVSKFKQVTDTIADMGDIEIKTSVSGYDIPRMVNNKTSKVALSLAEVLFKSTENLDMKSYLVYLLPIFGVLCAFLAFMGLKNKLSILAMTIIGGAVSLVGLYNLHTMDMNTVAIKITIATGLWHTMYAFLFIAFIGLIWLVIDRKAS